MSKRTRKVVPETPASTPSDPGRKREDAPAQQAGGKFVDGELVERTKPQPDTLEEREE